MMRGSFFSSVDGEADALRTDRVMRELGLDEHWRVRLQRLLLKHRQPGATPETVRGDDGTLRLQHPAALFAFPGEEPGDWWDPAAVEHTMPSISRLAAGFVGAVARVAARAVTGSDVSADDATSANRLAICQACPHLSDGACKDYRDAAGKTHSGCGCRVSVKMRLAAEKCPQGKW